jgi:hypothetical protein
MSKSDFYTVLGVSKTDSQAAIKAAYYRLAQQYHPDKNEGNPQSAERFKEINESYQVLSDVQRRKAYDNKISGKRSIHQDTPLPFVYYLKFTAEKTFIKQFEEVKVQFAFPSEARFFKRQKFNDWFIVEGPMVFHADVEMDGIKRKETQISYILAPLKLGAVVVEGPSVVINSKRVTAEPLYFTVINQQCFVNNELATGQPLIIELEKEEIIKTSNFIKSKLKKRLIIIPLGKKYKANRTKTLLLSLIMSVGISLLLVNMNSPVWLAIIIFSLMYFGIKLFLEKLFHQASHTKIISNHPVYLYLKSSGFGISNKHVLLNISSKIHAIQKRIFKLR